MIKVAVVEDEKLCREQIIGFLKRYGEEKNIKIEVTEYQDGEEIIEDYKPCYNVIFMDIEMPMLDGMKAARLIRKKDEHVAIVFITNIAHYAVKGYEVGALDYVLKPLRYEAFATKLNRIVKACKKIPEESILISNGNETYRISVQELLYVEVLNHKVIYHLPERKIPVYSSLREAEKLLMDKGFEKCNSCYLVNLRHVKGIKDNYALVGNEMLQISRARKKLFIQALAGYIGGR